MGTIRVHEKCSVWDGPSKKSRLKIGWKDGDRNIREVVPKGYFQAKWSVCPGLCGTFQFSTESPMSWERANQDSWSPGE